MKLNLLDRNGRDIELKDLDSINVLLEELKKFSSKNPTKGILEKTKSLLASETFHTLFTEGEVSSRRSIRESFVKDDSRFLVEDNIKNFIGAYNFVVHPKEFSISNMFTLYKLISTKVINKDSELKDGEMYRSEDVFIKSNQLAGEFKGFAPEQISPALQNLFNFLNNSELDIYLKAVIGHIYFEMIHPYYDFNGRTGRFIPLWLFTNSDRTEEMLYFATAIGNFKEQYRSIFNQNIDHRTYVVNMDRMVKKLIILLIVNQHQYAWIKDVERQYISLIGKSFSNLQKDFIWYMMNKYEISNSSDGWLKFNDDDKKFVELNLRLATLSNDTNLLKEAGIIQITNDKPRKYKLNNYILCPIKDL